MSLDRDSKFAGFGTDRPLTDEWGRVGPAHAAAATGDDLFEPDRDSVGTAGVVLAHRLTDDNRRRYEAVVRLDRLPDRDLLQDYIVFGTCCVVESELRELVEQPGRAHYDALLAVSKQLQQRHKDKDHDDLYSVMSGWKRQKHTLGSHISAVLWALAGAVRAGLPGADELVAACLPPWAAPLVGTPAFCEEFCRLMEVYRNPVAHGGRAKDYPEFTRLTVGNESVWDWHQTGPNPCPPRGAPVLHSYLACRPPAAGERAAEPTATARLLALLGRPPGGPTAAVSVGRPDADPNRNLQADEWPEAAFLVGEDIRIVWRTSGAEHAVVLDVGAGGTVQLLRPNRFHPRSDVEPERWCTFPDGRVPEVRRLTVGHPLGTEHVLVLATVDPPPAFLAHDPARALCRLTEEQVGRLVDWVNALPPTAWAAEAVRFRVEG